MGIFDDNMPMPDRHIQVAAREDRRRERAEDEPDWERLDQLSRRAFDRAADALRCHEIASPGSMPAKTWGQTPDHVKDRWRMAASVVLNAAGVVGLHEVLALILPLAKGYAHANPHDVNNRVIEAAEEALRRHEATDR
ncbi:MAG TPA: hypothetical protein VEA41_21510 [Salinarimonas sp.]|nr:hypothetical protein [Salinarimonas sp.]